MNDFGRDDKHRTGGNRVGPWFRVKTSALGQKRTCAVQKGMSALPPKADIRGCIGTDGALFDDVTPRFIRTKVRYCELK